MENMVRGLFSSLAAAVTLVMGQEWATWAWQERAYWKYLPAAVLLVFSAYEANKAYRRFDSYILKLRTDP